MKINVYIFICLIFWVRYWFWGGPWPTLPSEFASPRHGLKKSQSSASSALWALVAVGWLQIDLAQGPTPAPAHPPPKTPHVVAKNVSKNTRTNEDKSQFSLHALQAFFDDGPLRRVDHERELRPCDTQAHKDKLKRPHWFTWVASTILYWKRHMPAMYKTHGIGIQKKVSAI